MWTLLRIKIRILPTLANLSLFFLMADDIGTYISGRTFSLGVQAFEAWLYTFISHKSHQLARHAAVISTSLQCVPLN